MSYEWRKGSQIVATTSTRSYTLALPAPADSGDYTVVDLSNAAGSVTSSTVSVTVKAANPPIVVTDVASATRYVHGRVTFSVVVDGTPPFTYQWYHGATAAADAKSATLVLTDLETADSGAYHVEIKNDFVEFGFHGEVACSTGPWIRRRST